ncbi:MAG: aminoacyl-tRNA hydrolase [bacterium]
MKLVVGLGNPGKEYAKSKHNIGFMVLSSYAAANKLSFTKSIKFHGELVKLSDAVLLKPKTFMNNSGLAVRAVAAYYGIKNEDILVISDDLDLPFQKIRLRERGSAGGHNGLKSIIDHLQNNEFKRLRIGIGRDDGQEVVDYVLDGFTKAQTKELSDLMITGAQIIAAFLADDSFDAIMTRFN